MSFFGKKRKIEEKNLSLPEVSDSSQRFGDDIKFPEFPTYESTVEMDNMKANEMEYRSNLNKQQTINEIPKRKMTDTFAVQSNPNFSSPNYNFKQTQESTNFIPLRQKQARPPQEWNNSPELDQSTSNFDFNNSETEENQQKPQPMYENDAVEAPVAIREQPNYTENKTILSSNYQQEKPVFIKLENYKDVLSTIENIRRKIKEAESILESKSKVRSEEERALESWKSQIETVKNKLLDIDKKLFE